MKRIFSLILFMGILATSLMLPLSASAAITDSPTRVINIVYDDSGSMYSTNGGQVDTWCQAKYSMEVFAAMLGDTDTLNIYYMSDYQSGTGSAPRLTLQGKDGAATNVSKLHNETTKAGNTPFDSVRKAYSDLTKANADEKWLVVLTDGEFQGVDSLDAFFSQKQSDIKVMFLGMGPAASGITPHEDKEIYYVEAKTNSQILNQITGICTRIFNSNRLEVNASTKAFSFDVPMGELIVFAQGANVQINGVKKEDGTLIKSAKTPVEVKYSNCDASNYNNPPATELVGSIATFIDDFSTGNYTVDVSGAETIEIYYKPNVEIAAYLKDAQGNEVTDLSALEAGEYTIEFGFVKAGTKEKVAQSKLLGDVTYEARVTNNGNQHEQVYGSGDKITLEEGTLSIDVVARYLDYNSVSTTLDYSIFKNKTIEFSIVDNPDYTVASSGFTDSKPIVLKATIDGHEFTEEQWSNMGVPDVNFVSSPSFSMGEFKVEKTDQLGIFHISPTIKNDRPSAGTYSDCDFKITYEGKFGDETWSGSTDATLKMQDSRSWIERNCDLFIKLLILAILLFLIIGYLPFIKNYLPKSLKKEPTINCTPDGIGMEFDERTRNGLVTKSFISTIIPYVPQKATIEFVPNSVSGVPALSVRAIKHRRMLVTNIKDYADRDNITFNGQVISPNTKKFETSAALKTSVVKNGWVYDCSLNH